MDKRKITLIGLLFRKLRSHGRAMWALHRRFNPAGKVIGWPVMVVLSSVVMFFPAAMHFMFEAFMFSCGGKFREQFRRNLLKIDDMMNEKERIAA